jgi:hypothetical protein
MKPLSPEPHLARTPGQLEKFPDSFIEEMDAILIQPEWFNASEGYFKEELLVGTEYERLIRTTMAELKAEVVPQLIGQWLFVLGNACKQARLKRMKDWPEFVKVYHVLIAKLILSDAYALFTHHEKEDWIFLEGLALWAGHDYSSAKGQDHIAYWAEEYRRLIMQKGTTANVPTYHHWSNRIRVVLQGPRALRELAQIVVYPTKCMGKGKSLYVPPQLIAKIQQRGGAVRLKQCIEGNKALSSRDFTSWPRQFRSDSKPGRVRRPLKTGRLPNNFWTNGRRAKDWRK